MDNQNFMLAFDVYITFISKFKPDFSALNAYQLSQLKLKYDVQLNILATATQSDFNNNNFVTNFSNAFLHYSNLKLNSLSKIVYI